MLAFACLEAALEVPDGGLQFALAAARFGGDGPGDSRGEQDVGREGEGEDLHTVPL